MSEWVKGQELRAHVADALLRPIEAEQAPGLAQFAFCKGLGRGELRALLRDGGLLDAIEEALWRGVLELRQQ